MRRMLNWLSDFHATPVASPKRRRLAIMAATSVTLPQLVAWRFVQGIVTPGIFAVTMAYIHEEWPAARAGRATAAYIGGTSPAASRGARSWA